MKVRKWFRIGLILVLLFAMTGCSAASTKAMDSIEKNSAAMDYAVAETIASSLGSESLGDNVSDSRKWIVTVNMHTETEDLNGLLSVLDEKIRELGGYVEASQISNGSAYSASVRYRSASMTVRVPAEKVNQFTDQVSGASNVVSHNLEREDVTLNYVSVESRMKALQVEEERLLALLEQAENMSDLLEIESRLTEVRAELERVTSQLRVYDNQVDYATIYLNISEVREYTVVVEQTVWQRIGTGFVNSLKAIGNFLVELFIFLIANLPYLILLGGIIWLIVFLCRRAAIKRRARYQPPRPPYYPPAPDQNNPQ